MLLMLIMRYHCSISGWCGDKVDRVSSAVGEKVQIKLRHGTGHKNQKEKQEKYT
jgi:hypothetical protein